MQHDLLRERLADAGDVAEQLRARGVELDADVVDALSTTSPRRFASSDSWTSCWYWPTPIDFGSILTSSASGSCSRRAIEIAPRIVRSSSGNSSRARSDAEYTLAPASLTDTTCDTLHAGIAERLLDEALRLAAAGAVADRDRARRVLLHERGELLLRLRELRVALRDVDRDRAEELAGRVDRGALAAGAQARIDADHRGAAERSREHQVAQVAGEDVDGAAKLQKIVEEAKIPKLN